MKQMKEDDRFRKVEEYVRQTKGTNPSQITNSRFNLSEFMMNMDKYSKTRGISKVWKCIYINFIVPLWGHLEAPSSIWSCLYSSLRQPSWRLFWSLGCLLCWGCLCFWPPWLRNLNNFWMAKLCKVVRVNGGPLFGEWPKWCPQDHHRVLVCFWVSD